VPVQVGDNRQSYKLNIPEELGKDAGDQAMDHGNNVDDSISRLVKRYPSLFTLPTLERILQCLCGVFLLGGVLSAYSVNPTFTNVALGLLGGFAFFGLTVASDYVLSKVIMGQDPIYDLRRCSAVSLFSSFTWLFFIVLGSAFSIVVGVSTLWVRLFLLGFCAATIFRMVIFSTTSLSGYGRILFSTFLQPLLCLTLASSVWSFVGRELNTSVFWFVPSAILIILFGVFLFIFSVELTAKSFSLRVSALRLFKAFLASWTEDLNGPLESFFEELGDETDVQVSLLGFRSVDGRMKALVVVPSFHPGPFRNLGSSLIPSMIQQAVEKQLHCPVAVPHGLFGHELDLASKEQSERIIKAVVESLSFPSSFSKATPFVRVQEGGASATCQLFGDCAFVTLTLAPKTTEDLPPELGEAIQVEAEKLGLSTVMVVNAHNSIEGRFKLDEALPFLKKAAVMGLAKAMVARSKSFQIGVATVKPKEYGLREGMGPGGIVALVTRVGEQNASYVVIDGNNMVSGLREEILEALSGMGIETGEVLTTDTHAVCGIVLDSRGYHPIGEVMNRNRLIEYVKQAVSEASENLEPVEATWRVLTVRNVKVIGAKQIDAMCLLADRAAKRAKKAAFSIFPALGVALIALLTLF